MPWTPELRARLNRTAPDVEITWGTLKRTAGTLVNAAQTPELHAATETLLRSFERGTPPRTEGVRAEPAGDESQVPTTD